jgi:hypothetical protein
MATIHASTAADKPAPHESLLAPVLAYLDAGRSVVPIAPGLKTASLVRRDTGESITIRWKPYQNAPASAAELRRWFSGMTPMGIGFVTGPVSGTMLPDGRRAALEVLDFDDAQTLKAFLELAVARGYRALIPQLPFERTPSGGGHLGYLCTEWAGNTKLAERKIGTNPNGSDEVRTLIETRGEGGQCVVAPTPPGIHPDYPDRGYTMRWRSWGAIPLISPDARQALWECARALNEYVALETAGEPAHAPSSHARPEGSPGEDFNQRADRERIISLLERQGWTLVHQRHGTDYLRRPGKDGHSWSATLGHVAPNVLYVFSSNAHPFQAGHGYKPFSIYGLLEHRGDFHAAARALAAEGYGTARRLRGGHIRPEAAVPLARRLLAALREAPNARKIFNAMDILAVLPTEEWALFKSACKTMFGKQLNLNDLEQAFHAARRRRLAPSTREAPPHAPDGDGLPRVLVTNRPLRDVAEEALGHWVQRNQPPHTFVRTGSLIRVRPDEYGRPMLDVLQEAHARGRLHHPEAGGRGTRGTPLQPAGGCRARHSRARSVAVPSPGSDCRDSGHAPRRLHPRHARL